MVFDQLVSLLDSQGARYRVIAHAAEGKSDEVARIRGTEPGQGAKAMLCKTKDGAHWALAILPGDQRLDFRLLAAALGWPKLSLASPDEATRETGCVIGAIPPFSFSPSITLVADPALLSRYAEIAFNAGRLDRSMVLDSADYQRIAQPQLHAICSV